VQAAQRLFDDCAQRLGLSHVDEIAADARLVQFVQTQLAGAIGSASARAMVTSVTEKGALDLENVLRIRDAASQLRACSHVPEEKPAAAGAGHRRAARGQPEPQPAGPYKRRCHLASDAQAALALDINPGTLGTDARRWHHEMGPAAAVSRHHRDRG
jgi:hypothetical protein